jgi:hypothetical protein
MAITIIKKGELPEKAVFVGKCLHCKTELEFLREDATNYYHDQRDGLTVTVGCPVCSKTVYGSPKQK